MVVITGVRYNWVNLCTNFAYKSVRYIRVLVNNRDCYNRVSLFQYFVISGSGDLIVSVHKPKEDHKTLVEQYIRLKYSFLRQIL
jgi:hypothetical protein